MSNVTIQARIDPKLKSQAESIFNEIGLKTSDAIRMFLKQSVNCQGLPFRPQIKNPNKTTIDAMNEIKKGQSKKFNTIEELFED